MQQDEIPDRFSDLELKEPLKGRWMHITDFTTESNYKDKESDSILLKEAEETASELGYSTFCVPLPMNHLYLEAFPFFEGNGYQNVGTIKWVAGPNEKIDCYFYSKSVQANSQ